MCVVVYKIIYLFIYTEMVQLRAQRNITVHESSILFVACCFVACCLLPVACYLLPVACYLLPVACCLLLVAQLQKTTALCETDQFNGFGIYRRYHIHTCMYYHTIVLL